MGWDGMGRGGNDADHEGGVPELQKLKLVLVLVLVLEVLLETAWW